MGTFSAEVCFLPRKTFRERQHLLRDLKNDRAPRFREGSR